MNEKPVGNARPTLKVQNSEVNNFAKKTSIGNYNSNIQMKKGVSENDKRAQSGRSASVRSGVNKPAFTSAATR